MAGDRLVARGDRPRCPQRLRRLGVRSDCGWGDLDAAPTACACTSIQIDGRPDRFGARGSAGAGRRTRSIRRVRADGRVYRQEHRPAGAVLDHRPDRNDRRMVVAGDIRGRCRHRRHACRCTADQASRAGGDGVGRLRPAGVLLRRAGRARRGGFWRRAHRYADAGGRNRGSIRVGPCSTRGLTRRRRARIRDSDNRQRPAEICGPPTRMGVGIHGRVCRDGVGGRQREPPPATFITTEPISS